MPILTTKLPSLNLSTKSMGAYFEDQFQTSEVIDVAVGYVSIDSVIEIRDQFAKSDNAPKLNLIVGMYDIEGITQNQYDALASLNSSLLEREAGSVSVVSGFKYHGKIYAYSKGGRCFAATVGSSNLDSILASHASFEVDATLIRNEDIEEISQIIESLKTLAIVAFENWKPTIIEKPLNLEATGGIETCSLPELGETIFHLPLKDMPRSNLNSYFGSGRKDTKGIFHVRPWYEVEPIVPSSILTDPRYPKTGQNSPIEGFKVITDDGYTFYCRTSGDNHKNFGSKGDLSILGRWVKGRLERSGSLVPGEPVTAEVIARYGRNDMSLVSTNEDNVWFLDMSVVKS